MTTRRLLPLLLLGVVALGPGCGSSPVGPDPFVDDRAATIAGLNAARTRWSSAGIRDYFYTLRQTCFCGPTLTNPVVVLVQGGRVARVTDQASGEPLPADALEGRALTVDDLFARLQQAVDEGAQEVRAEYDGVLAYPTRLYVDTSQLIADEELSIETSGLTALR